MSSMTRRLDRYKLDSEITENSVIHRTIQSDLHTRRRRIQVLTTWVHQTKLGEGAFGEVSLQREKASGKLRAVKAIAKSQLRTHEMEALIDLQDHCDLFVMFLGWYESPGLVHIAMEYIAHGDLGQYIAGHPVETREAQEIAFQILEGLVVLHKREICHRDLKPQNILMASLSPLWVKITDFGISKRWAGTALQTHCGTPLYQAPELIGLLPRHMKTGGQMYTSSVDIWALGAVVHQVLTSEIPFLEIDLPLDDSIYESMGVSIDGELLLNYCAGRVPFPIASLTMHGANADAVHFITGLMVPDPTDRLTAASALQSVWLSDIASRRLSELENPGLPLSSFTELAVEGRHGEAEVLGRTSLPQLPPRDNIVPPSTAPSDISRVQANPPNTPGPPLFALNHTSREIVPPSDEFKLGPPQSHVNPSREPSTSPSRSGARVEPSFMNPRRPPPRPSRFKGSRDEVHTVSKNHVTPNNPVKPDSIFILLIGNCDGGKSRVADILSLRDAPNAGAPGQSLRVTLPFRQGNYQVQLVVGPDSSDNNYFEKVVDCMSRFPGQYIHGIIHLHSAPRTLEAGTIAQEISSIAKLCVPYFTRNMFIWANTSVTKPRWWARGESQIDVISYGESNTHLEGLQSGLENKCKAYISHIVHEHQVYKPSEVGIPDAYQTWLTPEYIRMLAVAFAVNPMPSRITID